MADVIADIVINTPLAPVTSEDGTIAAVVMIVASVATTVGLCVLAFRSTRGVRAYVTKIWAKAMG